MSAHNWDPQPLRIAVATMRLCDSGDRLTGRPRGGPAVMAAYNAPALKIIHAALGWRS